MECCAGFTTFCMFQRGTDVDPGNRSILNFALDQLYDPARFAELEQSLSEMVVLNETFCQLPSDTLG